MYPSWALLSFLFAAGSGGWRRVLATWAPFYRGGWDSVRPLCCTWKEAGNHSWLDRRQLPLKRPFGDSLCLSLFPCNPQLDLAFFPPSLLDSSSFRSCLGLRDESPSRSLEGSIPFGPFSSLIDVCIYELFSLSIFDFLLISQKALKK